MTTTARPGGKDLRVFISYRRSDCQAQANGLHDGLVHRLPGASIFMDIDSIPYGVDFEKHIRSEITSCDVVLVLIGDDWLDTTNSDGVRRLDDPDDFVRLEIENALATPSVRVVPVLVEGATMPRTSQLPPGVAPLARLNAIELNDQRWKADLKRLSEVVESIGRPEPAPAPVPTPQAVARTPVAWAPPMPGGESKPSKLMIALPLLSMGFAAWVPALRASRKKEQHDPARRRLQLTALALGAIGLLGIVLIGSTPAEPDGTVNGAAANVGTTLVLVAIALGTLVAWLERNAGVEAERRQAQVMQTPWMRQAVASRDAREHHRRLALQDPRLAQANHVGRPDVQRPFDDGGLLDLNSLPIDALVNHAGLSRQEAQALVDARERFGRLTSIDELVVHAGVDSASAERLRDYAVFL